MNKWTGECSGERTSGLGVPAGDVGRTLVNLEGMSHHKVPLLLEKLLTVALLLGDLAFLLDFFLPREIYHLGLLGLGGFLELVGLAASAARDHPGQDCLADLLLEIIVSLLLFMELLLREVFFVVSCRGRYYPTLEHRVAQR